MNANAAPSETPVRPLNVFGAALTGVFAAACLGAVANAVNAWVSPQYFVTILRWEGVADVWRASIAQGILEGLLLGLLCSLAFTVGACIITRATAGYWFLVRQLLGIVAGACVSWLIGGALAMGLATLSPEFYRATFVGVPTDFGPMLAYAWVGGSIWGIQLGGLLSVALGLVLLRGNWQQPHAADSIERQPWQWKR